MASQDARRRYDLDEPLDDGGHDAAFSGATLSLDAPADDGSPASLADDAPPRPGDLNANVAQKSASQATVVWQVPFFGRSLPDSKRFFADRDGAFERAVEMCKPVMLENLDGRFQGAWLLTEIDHWDNEKERFVILTERSLLIIKYDFITLNIIEYRRIDLRALDCLIHGVISYPEKSLMPKISGAVGHVKGFVTTRLQRHNKANQFAQPNQNVQESFFRGRNAKALRCMWNKGRPLQFSQNWNPWSREIPFVTLTAHRLYYSEDAESKQHYDIDTLTTNVINTVTSLNASQTDPAVQCLIKEERIVIENYMGIVSVVHNVADLGFFKSRGRVSF